MALAALVDVMERSDAERMPNSLPCTTDEEWDAALAKAKAVLGEEGGACGT